MARPCSGSCAASGCPMSRRPTASRRSSCDSWRELERGADVADPKAWAFRAIYRLAMDEHRLRRRVAGLVALLGAHAPRVAAAVEDVDRISAWEEVDRLPTRQRQVLYLRYRADLPYDEIGTVLGMTASAARSHATQAMATLRQRLIRPTGARRFPDGRRAHRTGASRRAGR